MSRRTEEFLKAFYADQPFPHETMKENEEEEIEESILPVVSQKRRQSVSKRTFVSLGIVFLAILLVLVIMPKLGSRNYLTASLLLLGLAMLPFFIVFENRKPQARELIILAVLIALAVAGRGAFFMLPQVKPVAAIVIITGIAFGPESGFLVGCFTALVSNIFFSQGPWTPWQMFAFGMIGFIAGLLYRWGLLKKNRWSLALFGFFSIFFIYGGIMNPASVLLFMPTLNKDILLAAFISGAPMDLIHGISTAVFLILFANPFLEKLQRVKQKYGLL